MIISFVLYPSLRVTDFIGNWYRFNEFFPISVWSFIKKVPIKGIVPIKVESTGGLYYGSSLPVVRVLFTASN